MHLVDDTSSHAKQSIAFDRIWRMAKEMQKSRTVGRVCVCGPFAQSLLASLTMCGVKWNTRKAVHAMPTKQMKCTYVRRLCIGALPFMHFATSSPLNRWCACVSSKQTQSQLECSKMIISRLWLTIYRYRIRLFSLRNFLLSCFQSQMPMGHHRRVEARSKQVNTVKYLCSNPIKTKSLRNSKHYLSAHIDIGKYRKLLSASNTAYRNRTIFYSNQCLTDFLICNANAFISHKRVSHAVARRRIFLHSHIHSYSYIGIYCWFWVREK